MSTSKEGGPKVKCLHCGDIMQSMHRHDYKHCSCRAITVDGGTDYFRFGEMPNARWSYDLDAQLVGPRDNSEDKQWCQNCKDLCLESEMEERLVDSPWKWQEGKVLLWFCKEPCKFREW